MFLDALTLVSDAQAFGAGAVSTSSIDLGASVPKREIGTGEPVSLAVSIDVSATVAAVLIEIISATNAALTAGVLVHATRTVPLAEAIAGAIFQLGLPQGTPTQQFLGCRVTTAGGTVSATCWFAPFSMISVKPQSYAKGYAN